MAKPGAKPGVKKVPGVPVQKGILIVEVHRPNGDPVVAAEVELVGIVKKNTNEKGLVNFGTIEAKTYDIKVRKHNFGPPPASGSIFTPGENRLLAKVTPGTTPTVVKLPLTLFVAALKVTIKTPDGHAIPDCEVEVVGISKKSTDKTKPSDTVDFGVVPAGKLLNIKARKVAFGPVPSAGAPIVAGEVASSRTLSDGEKATVALVLTQAKIEIKLIKIETTNPTPPPAFHSDDDFSPRLGEKAKVHVEVHNLEPAFAGTLRIDFGRLTNRPDSAATKDKNESFTLVSRVDTAIHGAATSPVKVEVDWNGKATVAVVQEFSKRKTKNNNSGAQVNIPMDAMASGDPLIHGLYFIDQLSVLQGATERAKLRPPKIDLSVPILVNLTFNGNWPGDLSAFGLTPFRAKIEEALRRFGGRDYMIRDPSLGNRMNARYLLNAGVTNSQAIAVSIGGPDPAGGGLFGSTPDGPAPLSDNIYVFKEGLGATISIFPSTFMTFNTAGGAISPLDQPKFQAIFGALGVAATATVAAAGVATARTVVAGVVSGATNATDFSNVNLALDNDGIATVTSTNLTTVPAARAAAIQTALRAFVRMVGNTTNHEIAHGLGVVSRVSAKNKVTISGTTVTSPLNGDGGAHNKVTNNTNIVDAGGTRSFVRRIEDTGVQQKFNATNTQYMRDCIPFDQHDD
jgi:hypothetical protein